MEFRLNKVDPEVRQRVRETTSTNRIHNKREIFVNNDQKKKGKNQGGFYSELNKYKSRESKNRVMVDATKVEEVKVNAFKDEENNLSGIETRGSIIDVKK